MEQKDTGFEAMGKLFITLLMIPIIYSIHGFVFVKLWNWFIVPLGVRGITIPLAVGLCLTFKMVLGFKRSKENPKYLEILSNTIVFDSFVLLCGYIYSLFV